MRAAAFLTIAAPLALVGCAAQPPKGGEIVSTNPCADAMLVELVAPERIAAISHYSHDPAATSLPMEVATRFAATRGTAEEVVAMQPRLVIAGIFTPSATREAYARAGLKVLYFDSPTTIAASQEQVRELAEAVDAVEAGRALNARIDAAVAAARFEGVQVPALLWIGGNLVSGAGTLLDEMMTRAGFSDHAAHYGLQSTGYLPMEYVVADPPRVMLVPDPPGRAATSRAAEMRRRALAHQAADVREVHFSRTLNNCGGPTIVKAMARLAEIRRSIEP